MTQDELDPATREARWQNACRWARQVNRALELGHLVFVGEGKDREEIKAPLQIRIGGDRFTKADSIFGPFEVGDESGTGWFTNDPAYDDGLYTEIDEWNEQNKIICYGRVPLPEFEGDLS